MIRGEIFIIPRSLPNTDAVYGAIRKICKGKPAEVWTEFALDPEQVSVICRHCGTYYALHAADLKIVDKPVIKSHMPEWF